MQSMKKSVVVNAPLEKVYRYLDDPLSMLEYWPSMVDIRDIQVLPNGGRKLNWTYKMAGIRLEGSSEDIEYEPRHRSVSKSTGGIDSILTIVMEPAGSGTRVDWSVDYTIPVPVFGKLAEAVIVKLNEHELDSILTNIKTRLEA